MLQDWLQEFLLGFLWESLWGFLLELKMDCWQLSALISNQGLLLDGTLDRSCEY